MRTQRVLCVVLLTVGACYGLPQYGPPKQEEQQVAVVPEPVAPSAGSLSEQQKEQLGEFWWQNQGVFTGENAGGTVVVVQEQNSPPEGQVQDEIAANPFIPSPSPECGEYHGCIPWQFCVEGVFTNTGEGLLALRTPSKVPETYTQKLCGQIGNICCRIPDSILSAQQQGPSEGAGPYGGGTGDILPVVDPQLGDILPGVGIIPDPGSLDALKPEIIEVISTGDVLEPVIDEVGGTYDTGAGAADLGPEQVSGGGIVDQVPGGPEGNYDGVREDIDQQVVGSVGIVEVADTGCPAYTHDCVPYFQCIDGEINTSGAGLIDVRIRPQKECTNPEYPEIPGLCCKIPGATPLPVDPTPVPIQECPGTQVCVADSQCNYDGTVNTDGTGLIDTRLRTTCYLSYVDAATYESGVCCQPPAPVDPAPLVTCPGTQVCVAQGQCITQTSAGTDYNVAAVTSCYYSPDQAVLGECCDPPTIPEVPVPEPLDPCPGTQECVEEYQCKSDGTINTDGAGLINTRIYANACYLDTVNYARGVCCQPPTPPVPEPIVTCPGSQVCLSAEQCASQTTVDIASGPSYTTDCYLDTVSYAKGVCCQPPTPPVPEPIVTCPGSQVCLSADQCASQTLIDIASGPGYIPCVLDSASYATGVCCDSPVRLVDICPDDSVCIPDILCQGEILTDADQYKPYGSSGDWSWSQCLVSGDANTPGVCCRNPEPVPPSNPYVAAEKCGVRNYGLDLRSPVRLQKNEAQFGEFPWQAIIFFTNYTFKCGASLIDNKWLITAAHCVDGYTYGDFRVRLGEWQVDKYDEPLKYQDVDIASITIHPDFKPGPVHNDVALIELTEPVTFQYHINSVCIPGAGQKPVPGTRCFASGWGKDAFEGNYQAILKKVDVPYVDHAYCQDLLRKTRLGKYFILDQSFMCAGGEENIDACEGDGGGPLVCKDEEAGAYYLAGITAWGIDCGQKDVPGVYADVQLFRPWIDSIVYGQLAEQQEQQISSGAYGK